VYGGSCNIFKMVTGQESIKCILCHMYVSERPNEAELSKWSLYKLLHGVHIFLFIYLTVVIFAMLRIEPRSSSYVCVFMYLYLSHIYT
jgi:hypothetical protein